MIDLDPRYLETIQKILQIYAHDKTIWAYGSRVKGTAHSGSDLDLVIIDNNESGDSETTSTLRSIFRESNLPILVDILNWSDIPDSFKKEIEMTHEVLQQPSQLSQLS